MKIKPLYATLIASVSLLSACSSEGELQDSLSPTTQSWASSDYRCDQRSISWQDVNDWHYQLSDADYQQLTDSNYDLLVIDSEPYFRPNQNIIDRIKCSGESEKLVVSYLAIGQAENYRYYWQSDWKIGSPSWIAYADTFWPGDFYVRYWEPQWREILMGSDNSRIDRIIDAGFDGIYLDTIDAYEFFLDENPSAIEDMQKLIADIASYARTKSGNPDFGVFVQNAEELIHTVGPEWVTPLTGIGKEEPFYWAMDDRVGVDQRYWNDLYLGQWVAAGKLVLSVDYVTTEAARQDVYTDAQQRGYVPLTLSSKYLDRMDQFEGFLPD